MPGADVPLLRTACPYPRDSSKMCIKRYTTAEKRPRAYPDGKSSNEKPKAKPGRKCMGTEVFVPVTMKVEPSELATIEMIAKANKRSLSDVMCEMLSYGIASLPPFPIPHQYAPLPVKMTPKVRSSILASVVKHWSRTYLRSRRIHSSKPTSLLPPICQ